MVIDPLGLLYVLSGGTVDVYDSSFNHKSSFVFAAAEGGPKGGTDSLALDSQGVAYETLGNELGIIDNGNFLGFVPLTGQFLWAGPDRSLFVADQNADTLSNCPPESNQVQSIWNLPAQPIGVYADQSRLYVPTVASVPGINRQTITIDVYPDVFISSVTPPTGGDRGQVTLTINGRGFQQNATATLSRTGQADITGSKLTVCCGRKLLQPRSLISQALPTDRGTWW